jgi:ATP-dependent helicase/nuclease subunit A
MLADIRIHQRKGLFSEVFFDYARNGADEAIKEKIQQFIIQLDKWRIDAKNMDVETLIWMLFEETNYYYYVGSMPGGRQRTLNLEMLADKAAQFEQTSLKGLFNFLRYIERIERGGKDFGVAKALGENDDVVRMMSIHKSKGLEFPIVFVAGLGRKFNMRDMSRRFISHKQLGIGAKYMDARLHCSSISFAQLAMKQRIHDEMLAEELRVLYVALTRAKNECHLFGTATASKKQFWQGGTNAIHLLNATSFLDWLGAYLEGTKSESIQADVFYEKVKIMDSSTWGYQYINKRDVLANMPLSIESTNAVATFEKPCTAEWISERLMWEYVYHASAKVPSKLSVTEIKRLSSKGNDTQALFERGSDILALRELYLEKRPTFMQAKKQLSPIERGLAVHFAMQHIDVQGDCSEVGIQEQIAKLLYRGMMNEEQVANVDIQKLKQFIDSELGQRMRASSEIRRELPFNLVKKASETSLQFEACNENVLIQGIIDCCFLEEGQWVLIDYKTDAVIKGREHLVAERYRMQLELYKEALIKITSKQVKESFIYLFSVNEAIKLRAE